MFVIQLMYKYIYNPRSCHGVSIMRHPTIPPSFSRLPTFPLNHWNLIIPDNLLPKRSNHERFGASSISLTKSWKYVGWLLGSSKRPLSLNYHTPQISRLPIFQNHIVNLPDHYTDPAAETATPSPSTSPQAPSTAYNSDSAPRPPCRGHPGAGDPVEGTALAIAQRLPCRSCAAVCQFENTLGVKKTWERAA